jgi:chemotaxis protein MotA
MRIDLATILGLVIALAAIVGGLILEGGTIHDIAQHTAGIIVVGGTLGAVLVSTPLDIFIGALKQSVRLFADKSLPREKLKEDILAMATKARRGGLVSLEDEAKTIEDPFLGRAITLAVDGCDMGEIRHMMENEIRVREEKAEAEAKVLEAAGGYAPTVGILGAVMGLIQVMKNLSDIKEVGHGIAVAFVATVYGVALANLVFLPAAQKLRTRIRHDSDTREMMLDGVLGMVEGQNPRLLKMRLDTWGVAPGEAGADGASAPVNATN